MQCSCGLTGGCPLCNYNFQPNTIVNNFPTIIQKGWECPKCGRVYSPACMEWFACNTLINNYGLKDIKV